MIPAIDNFLDRNNFSSNNIVKVKLKILTFECLIMLEGIS